MGRSISPTFRETKEHVGGFWVLKAADIETALERGHARPRSPVGRRSKYDHSTKPES